MDQDTSSSPSHGAQIPPSAAISNLSIEDLVTRTPNDSGRSEVFNAVLHHLNISPSPSGESNPGENEVSIKATDAQTPETLNHLGSSLLSQFQNVGEIHDIDRAISCYVGAISLTSPSSRNAHTTFSTLARALLSRYQRLGELRDLDDAIYLSKHSIFLTTSSDPSMPSALGALSTCLICQFEHYGQLSDLDQAVVCLKMAFPMVPEGHPDRAKCWSRLGYALTYRFERLGELSDLNVAIECYSQVLSLELGDNHEQFLRLGRLFMFRFGRLGDLADAYQSIDNHKKALALIPENHVNRAPSLSALGDSFSGLYEKTGEISNLEQAIECYSQAVASTPEQHVIRPVRLNKLADALSRRAEYVNRQNADTTQISQVVDSRQTGGPADIDASIKFYQRAAQAPVGHPFARLNAALRWAKLSISHQGASSLQGYQQVMNLVPQILWLGNSAHNWGGNLLLVTDPIAEAVAAAIQSQSYNLAMEWMEQARLAMWRPTTQLRSSLDNLRLVAPDLSDAIQTIASELTRLNKETEIGEPTLHRIRRLAEQWSGLIAHAQMTPGFEMFMKVGKAAELMSAAHSGAVVVVNTHESRCDALVILPQSESVVHVPLPGLSYDKADQACTRLAELTHGNPNLGQDEEAFESVLAMLWTDLVKPVLDSIGYTSPAPASDLPRITWCLLGPLASLPVHAAGIYTEPQSKIYDFAVSSYTPNLSDLLTGPRSLKPPSGVLGIGQASQASSALPPREADELDEIAKQTKNIRFTRLDDDRATVNNVTSAMKDHNWVHFTCPVAHNTSDPSTSAFQLSDGELDLATIIQTPLAQPDVAFLLGSQKRIDGQTVSDGALNLAGGMILARYPTVITKMWLVPDGHTGKLVSQVYAQILEGGNASGKDIARVLHNAVGSLREEVGVKAFRSWVPYIHVGI